MSNKNTTMRDLAQQREDRAVIDCMAKRGGDFVKRLADAYRFADTENQRRIREAFPEYWEKYKWMAEQRGL